MAASRYLNTPIAKTISQKSVRMASSAGRSIRRAVKNRLIEYSVFTLAEGQRLDVVSANYYGSAEYWWIIAAASGIGWQCQVPAGTVIIIPSSIDQVIPFL